MERLNPELVAAVFIVLAALVTIVCMLLNTIRLNRRQPSAETDLATLRTAMANLKAELSAKQSTRVCEKIVERLDRHHLELSEQLRAITERHSNNERDASRKLGSVHERINTVLSAISTLDGKFEMHTTEKKS